MQITPGLGAPAIGFTAAFLHLNNARAQQIWRNEKLAKSGEGVTVLLGLSGGHDRRFNSHTGILAYTR